MEDYEPVAKVQLLKDENWNSEGLDFRDRKRRERGRMRQQRGRRGTRGPVGQRKIISLNKITLRSFIIFTRL